jgi:ABC-type branched-subunit amino acid transport system substrate-binding protein
MHKEMKIFSSWTSLAIGMGVTREFAGWVGGIDYLWNRDDPISRKFLKAFRAEYGKPPDSYAYLTYTGLNEFAWAANKVGSLDQDKMTAALTDPNHKFDYGKGEAYWRGCDRRVRISRKSMTSLST